MNILLGRFASEEWAMKIYDYSSLQINSTGLDLRERRSSGFKMRLRSR